MKLEKIKDASAEKLLNNLASFCIAYVKKAAWLSG